MTWAAICDEEGKLKGKPINEEATAAWYSQLTGKHKWDDVLVGDIAIVYGGLS